MELNKLAKEVFANAFNKGFWDEYNDIIRKMDDKKEPLYHDIGFTQKEIDAVKMAFSAQRLMLIISELGEHIEAKRTGKIADWDAYQRALNEKGVKFDAELFKQYIKDSPGDEYADSIIRHMDQAGGEDIDLDLHVTHKMLYNAQRPRLHGKKF